MPIKIPNGLPALETLREENIFVMDTVRAETQDIRPLRIAVLNLMPTKIDTETQLARLLGNTPLQIEMVLVSVGHRPKNTSQEHMQAFYRPFKDIENENFDGMVITGAPVEKMDFEEVDYWDELCHIFEWTKSHVFSTLHICWGAQAALYYHYGIEKVPMSRKLSGIFSHHVTEKGSVLFRGFDDVFFAPHSRYTTISRSQVWANRNLKVLAESDEAGIYAISSLDGRQIFITGHSEYDTETLKNEYLRDVDKGIDPDIPENYFPRDDVRLAPICNWRSSANLMFSNWLNYFVYQETPFSVSQIIPVVTEIPE